MSPLLAPALALGLVAQQLAPGTPPAPEPPATAPPPPVESAPGAAPAEGAPPPAAWTTPAPPPPAWPPPPPAWPPPPPAWPPPPPAWPPPAPPPPYVSPYPPSETLVGGLPPTGVFEKGVGLNLLQLGPLEVISSGDTSYGVALGVGVELDLGPRTALRLPLEINYAGSSNTDASGVEQSTVFAYVGLSPGIVYRFRSERDQRWTAYLGGALKLGGFMFGRQLLGVAPNPPPATMQEFTRAGAAPDLMAGFLYTPFRWLTWRIAVDYTYIFVAHTSVHALAETIGPQLSF